jgi:hypothetical protein
MINYNQHENFTFTNDEVQTAIKTFEESLGY